jgi:hypothetical protein
VNVTVVPRGWGERSELVSGATTGVAIPTLASAIPVAIMHPAINDFLTKLRANFFPPNYEWLTEAQPKI